MPTYDYRCDACGHTFEQFQSITASSLRKCPECGKSKLKRLIGTGGAVLFKGEGFWQTDYRSQSYKQGAEADSKPTESKPAASGSETSGKSEPAATPATPATPAASTPAKSADKPKTPKSKKKPDQ